VPCDNVTREKPVRLVALRPRIHEEVRFDLKHKGRTFWRKYGTCCCDSTSHCRKGWPTSKQGTLIAVPKPDLVIPKPTANVDIKVLDTPTSQVIEEVRMLILNLLDIHASFIICLI
jgi:hypothetical protein